MKATIEEKLLAIEAFKDYWASLPSRIGLTEELVFSRCDCGFNMRPEYSNFLTHVDLIAIHKYSEEHLMPYSIWSIKRSEIGSTLVIEFDLTK